MSESPEDIDVEQPREVEATADGFTPIFDKLDEKYGNATARVFGAIWRYCRMREGVCRASLQKIAEKAGVDRRTVIRCIKTLEDDKLIVDTTPDVKNAPHVYRDGGVVRMVSKIAIEYGGVLEEGVTSGHSGVTQSHPRSDTVSLKDTIKTQDNINTAPTDNSASSRGNGRTARQAALERQQAEGRAKTPKTVTDAANEKVDIILTMELDTKQRVLASIRQEFESLTRLNIGDNWRNSRSPWYLFDEWLDQQEREHMQTFDVFLNWYFNVHNKNKQRNEVAGFLAPSLIKRLWSLAFDAAEDATTLIMTQHTKA